ncbi:hypothetical protein RB195_006559 [Necator americanus]
MRLLCVLLIAAHFRISLCQDENTSDIFDRSPEDVVGAGDFIGRTDEINEGSDSFAVSTAMIEPINEATTMPMLKQQEHTVEPLELTTRFDKNLNSSIQVLNIPSSADGTRPLPEEAMAADPFSLDEVTTTVKTSESPMVTPVVPIIHEEASTMHEVPLTHSIMMDTRMMTSMEPATTTMSATTESAPAVPTLEGRVLKEKEEELTTSIRDPTTDVHMGTETTETASVETTENQEIMETTSVSSATETTQNGGEPEEAHTHRAAVAIDAEVTTDASNSETTAFDTVASSTTEPPTTTTTFTTTTTTALDEDAAPFDQDKLSGLFEQDGSFIPEHLANPTSEPVFPRVELPEESTEIISDLRPKQNKSTSDQSSFSIDSQPTMIQVNDTTPAPTIPGLHLTDQLRPIVIQPIVTKTTINEVFHIARRLGLDSDDEHRSIPTQQSGAEGAPKHEDTTTSTTQGTTTEHIAVTTAEPLPEMTPMEMVTTTVSPMVEPKFETEVAIPAVPEPSPEPQPEPQPESPHEPHPETQPQPEPEQRTPEPEPERQPEPQPVPQPEPLPEPRPEPQPEPKPEPQPDVTPEHEPVPSVPAHRPETTSEPHPTSEPQPTPEVMLAPEPSEPHLEPTPEAMPAPEPKHHPEQTEPDNMPQNLKKAFFTMRIVSLEYMEDFADKSSGKYKKLCDQVIPQISVILKTIMGDNFVKFDVDSLMKGSVIVNGVIFTIDDIADAEDLATKIETAISANGSNLGQNEIDSRSITVNGIPSRAYIERVHSSYPQSSSPSPLLIGSIIAVGVLVILIVAFIVIAINNRRTNGTMKLKDDDLPRMETGKGSYSSPQTVSVNLMSYGNGTTTTPPNQGAMMTSLSVGPNEREVC